MEDGMPAQTEEQRYEMTQEIMQAVVAMYADTKDQELVRDAGKSVGHQRKMTSGERRNEVVNAIRGAREPQPRVRCDMTHLRYSVWQSLRARRSRSSSSSESSRRLR
jgi:hypothetical protein